MKQPIGYVMQANPPWLQKYCSNGSSLTCVFNVYLLVNIGSLTKGNINIADTVCAIVFRV